MKLKLDKFFVFNYEGEDYKIKNCSTFEEIQMDIRKRLKLEPQIVFKIKYLDNDGKYYVANDYGDLKDVTQLQISLILPKPSQ